MNIIGKILIGLIIVASFGFLYLAASMLSTEGAWQQAVVRKQKELEQALTTKDVLEHGGANARLAIYRVDKGLPTAENADQADKLGIDQYKLLLDQLIADRGRVWQARRQILPNGDVGVQIEKPTPAAIKDKTILYAFESKPIAPSGGGAYLGEFKATAPTGQNLTLVPAVRLSQAELDRLAQSDSSWMLYEVMPQDRSWTFAGLTDEQLKALLPESIQAPFLHAGQAEGYVRPLRAYGMAFRDLRHSIALTLDAISARTVELERLTQSVAGATAQISARDAEIMALTAEQKRTGDERDQISEQVSKLAANIQQRNAERDKLLAENKEIARRLAAAQWQAVRRVEQLSRAPQSAP